MNPIKLIGRFFAAIFNWYRSRKLFLKIVIPIIIVGAIGYPIYYFTNNNSSQVEYQTTKVEKGTLITSISSSGTITSGNSTDISTKVSGVVKTVYVTNGDKVTKGQKIAEVTLDDYAKERQSAAWVAYLDATEAVKQAEEDKTAADIAMWNDRQAVLDAQDEYNNMKAGGWNQKTRKEYTYNEQAVVTKTLEQAKQAFTTDETKYKDADANISNARTKVAAALRTYQENSSIIVAPAAGVVSNLMLAQGVTVQASTSTSSTTGSTIVSAQTIGKINDPEGQLIATVNLTEVDIIKVKANQKVNLTLDAYEDMSFTGKVLSVNTSGSVSSGVTSYPVTIILDLATVDIYPNMAVNAEIITDIKTDVISVPTTAITTFNNQSTVQVKKDGQVSFVTVQTGISNDSNTEITSGLSEGDEVVTGTISKKKSSSSTSTTSPFSGNSNSSSRSSSTTRSTIQMTGGMGGPPGF